MSAEPKNHNSKRLRSDLRIPESCDQFALLDAFCQWYRALWRSAGHANETDFVGLLRAYVSMVVDSGLPNTAAIDCICAYWKSPESGTEAIAISAQRFVNDRRQSTVSFHRMTRLAIKVWRKNPEWRTEITQQLLPKPKRLARLVTATLEKAFKSKTLSDPRYSTLRFADIVSLGHVIAQSQGVEPFLVTALSGKTRPTDLTEGDLGLRDISREAFSHVAIKTSGLTLRSARPRAAALCGDAETELEIPPTWIADAKTLLREMCRELGANIAVHVDSPRKRRKAQRILGEYRQRAASFSPDDSILCLAIDYTECQYVVRGKIKASTLRAYLDRTVICGFLNNEESYRMADWDSDDLVECLEERLSESQLSKRSKGLIATAFAPILRFLTERLGLPPVSIRGIKAHYVTGAGQWVILSPHAVDKLISKLCRDPDRQLRQAALVIALGYYGGLRAGDIKNLRLADIVFNDRLPDLDIEIRRGKSRNARRRLPLHALAPESTKSLVREFWTERLAEFPTRKVLSQIPLLGPGGSVDAYEFASIARLARSVLKQTFGEDTNIHTLRHCFCSILFLRWYSLRHPDLLKDLRDASHAVYKQPLQGELDRVFSVMPYEDGSIRPHDLISMIKLSGHSTAELLFLFYVHSFSTVQAHAVAARKSIVDDVEIDGRAVSLLLPGMRSPRSRAASPCQTLGKAAERVTAMRPQRRLDST